MQFDFENQDGVSAPFLPEIAVVSGVGSRLDGVIWSAETKPIVWIELCREAPIGPGIASLVGSLRYHVNAKH